MDDSRGGRPNLCILLLRIFMETWMFFYGHLKVSVISIFSSIIMLLF